MQINDLQRIKIVVKALISLGVEKNQEGIGRLLGYSNKSSFSQVLNGVVNLPSDFIDRLCALNEQINAEWVKTGRGNVLHHNADVLNDEIFHLENHYLEDQSLVLISEDIMNQFNAKRKEVRFQNSIRFFVPTFSGADYLITVKGNSMYPKFNNGDVLACKHLPLDTFFQWDKDYVINTEQGVLIKRICESTTADFIKLVSENKDYSAFEIPKSKILAIAIVTGIIRTI